MQIFKHPELRATIWAKRHIAAALLLAFAAGLLVSGLWGAYERYEMKKLEKLYKFSTQQNQALLNKQAELTLTSERLRANTQALTETIREQEQANRELERGLDFYRQLMDPSKVKKGLVLHNFSSTELEQRIYRMQFTFVQYALRASYMRAKLSFILKGQLEGQPVSINFERLRPESAISNKARKHDLNFRYFQEFEQLIQLPEGIEAQSIIITARISKPKVSQWQKELPWQSMAIEEPESNAESDEQPQDKHDED